MTSCYHAAMTRHTLKLSRKLNMSQQKMTVEISFIHVPTNPTHENKTFTYHPTQEMTIAYDSSYLSEAKDNPYNK